MNTHFINTGLQPGDAKTQSIKPFQRFSATHQEAVKTAKLLRTPFTGLKPGANEIVFQTA
jgi:hypothetical protein